MTKVLEGLWPGDGIDFQALQCCLCREKPWRGGSSWPVPLSGDVPGPWQRAASVGHYWTTPTWSWHFAAVSGKILFFSVEEEHKEHGAGSCYVLVSYISLAKGWMAGKMEVYHWLLLSSLLFLGPSAYIWKPWKFEGFSALLGRWVQALWKPRNRGTVSHSAPGAQKELQGVKRVGSAHICILQAAL